LPGSGETEYGFRNLLRAEWRTSPDATTEEGFAAMSLRSFSAGGS
jgi:hypothetical protein